MAIGSLYWRFLEIARERRIDIAAALREAQLDESLLLKRSSRLSPEQGISLGKALLKRLRYPEVGLEAARRCQLGEIDLLGYLLKYSHDLASALTALSRYGRLLGDTASNTIEYREDTVAVGLGRTGGRKMMAEASDFYVGLTSRMLREFSADRAIPREAQLPRAKPADPRPFERLLGVPVRFGCERGALIYPSSALTAPFVHSDPDLLRVLVRQADAELATLPPDADLVIRVRAHLARDLEHASADSAAVARTLGMSDRTLRRHLREAGTGFRELLDDVRREHALQLLGHAEHNVTTVGIRIGFRDATAFARAFRRWTGQTPSDYLRATTPHAAAHMDRAG